MRFSTILLVAGCALWSLAGAVRRVNAGESNSGDASASETPPKDNRFPTIIVLKEGALGAPEKAWAVGQDLNAMERLRKGKDTPFGLVEDRARQALSKHPDPEAQGRVYYQVAHTYAQGGINVKERAEKVVEYSQKALACPLDPVRRLRLYDYWGDALRFVDPDQPFPDWRRAAALVYLQGLKEAQKYHVPDKPPDPPLAATKVLRQESDEARRAPDAWKRRLEEIAAIRARALYETDLYHARKVLVGQIVDVYRRPPHAATELRQLADGILEDPAEVEAVMKAVEKEGGLSDDPPDAPKRPGAVPLEPRPWSWPAIVGVSALISVPVGMAVWGIRRRRLSHTRAKAPP